MEETIINIFKNHPVRELNTEFIAKEAYIREYSIAEDLLKSQDKSVVNSGKEKKFQLHRKTLYYLNKLVDNNIIKVSKIVEKGEKYFILLASEGDTILEKGYKKILITKPTLNTTFIEKYESKNLMKKFEENSWINRLNSILLECEYTKDINILYKTIFDCFTNVNDTIALNEFEIIINNSNDQALKDFLEKISKDSENYNKTISIIINLSSCNNNLNKFINHYINSQTKNSKRINIIFNITNRDLQKNSKNIINIFEKFSSSKIKINIKNSDIAKAPYFNGRAGIYNFDEQDWINYCKESKGKSLGISCSQSQIGINVTKFFEEYKSNTEFRNAVLDTAKTLLLANNIQRRKSSEYFQNINTINSENKSYFYKFNRNYIRFWNYDWHRTIHEDTFHELILSTKELVDNFCRNEETIFKSCGIPIRFKIAFSSAFKNFDQNFTGERGYKKITINKIEDYYSGEMKSFLQYREKMFESFDGGDRFRIFRSSNFSSSDIIHELGILLNAYRIPLFTYDFSSLRGTIKLTSFISQ
jgi:hypothetical protein